MSFENYNLQDWLHHLENLHPKGEAGITLGLTRMNAAKNALKQTPFCPVIIVGGTNGKGSTCAFLEAIYRAAGFVVGLHTSPHLVDFRERIKVSGQMIDEKSLCQAFCKIEQMRVKEDLFLSYFEMSTLAAWEVFCAKKVDVMILEVGLGGRLDAVNVYEPDVSIVTSIALDHQDWLGDTREKIGLEKAGIFRSGKAAICADQHPPESLLLHAKNIKANVYLNGREFAYQSNANDWLFEIDGKTHENLPQPALKGAHQLQNAAGALTAIALLQTSLKVSLKAIETGLQQAFVPCRFEIVQDKPCVILDVAHNVEAMHAFCAELVKYQQNQQGKTFAVLGMLKDKDIENTIIPLFALVDSWFLASLDGIRGESALRLQQAILAKQANAATFLFENPIDAFHAAKSAALGNDRIAVAGSFHTVAAIKSLFS